MGVDFYNCHHCGEIYDDCGHFYTICGSCGTRICYYCQKDLNMRDSATYFSKGAKPLGNYWQEDNWEDRHGQLQISYQLVNCPYCKKEIIDDKTVLNYLLNKYNLNKNDIVEEIKKN